MRVEHSLPSPLSPLKKKAGFQEGSRTGSRMAKRRKTRAVSTRAEQCSVGPPDRRRECVEVTARLLRASGRRAGKELDKWPV